MYPGIHGKTQPDKPAIILSESGEVVTHGELNDQSNRLAQLFHARGLRRGDHVAVFAENHPVMFDVAWAAFRSGLYVTAINRYLTADEAAYIINDSGADALVSTTRMGEVADQAVRQAEDCPIRLMADGVLPGWEPYEDAIAAHPAEPIAEESMGEFMLYSSGTTGRPKGISRPLSDTPIEQGLSTNETLISYGFDGDTVYLSPAPLYHAAPFAFTTAVQSLGGTVVLMPRFDEVEALRTIEKYKVTHSQWVPTMFIRMLKLEAAERERFDLSSHRVAVHAAAPCPVEIKRQMIEWWGPILVEYYAGTERNGGTCIFSEQWLEKPGSVGPAARGILHICDEDGHELAAGEPGLIYFEMPELVFRYHNDPEKTRDAQHPEHPNWTSLGDVGYVDEDGYLFLTDRKTFMIISGGVNIYPQAIEDALVMHPKVADVAVIGVPDEEMGEQVKAVVQAVDGTLTDAVFAEELIDWARGRVARYMVPKSVDFVHELPRLPTGKLYKKQLREKYWQGHDKRV